MDPADLRARLADLTRRLDELKLTEEMAPVVRVQVAATLDAIAAEADREIFAAVQSATNPELKDEGARFFRRLAQSNSWLDGREALSKAWIDKAAGIAVSPVLLDLIAEDQNRLRDPEAFAGVGELCRSGRVDKARRLMASRLRRTTDPVARKRIQEALETLATSPPPSSPRRR